MNNNYLSLIQVYLSPLNHSQGLLIAGNLRIPCALGQNGTTYDKREGDKKTPIGTFLIRQGYYRSDRISRPASGIPFRKLSRTSGWCDDPEHNLYNKFVRRPFSAGHEEMWREDHIYDVILDIGYNCNPVIRNRGSAVFLHIARPGYTPTYGCIAVNRDHIRPLLKMTGPRTRMAIRTNLSNHLAGKKTAHGS